MDALTALLKLNEKEKTERGVVHTPAEIAQQPEAWRQTYAFLDKEATELRSFLQTALGKGSTASVHPVGAGTSHFVGESVRHALSAAWRAAVVPVASTEIVLSPETLLAPDCRLMISFARSGQSPEGNAALQMVTKLRPDIHHLVVTCNQDGELARLGRELGDKGYCFVLPEMTNDKSLAMTSSFTSMVVAALALGKLGDWSRCGDEIAQMAQAAAGVVTRYADEAERLAGLEFNRAVFIANGDLYGVALESGLKMQEMSAGRVSCKAETTLGLRHGPMAGIDEKTLVVTFLSRDPYIRRYEMDLLAELAARELGLVRVAVADRTDQQIAACVDTVVELSPDQPLPDTCKAPVAVVFSQMLALFRSLAEGLSPDAPSPGGVIHRVVQGVRIYPYA